MTQSLLRQGIEHNKSGELSIWLASLSDSEKGQLWDELQGVLTRIADSLRGVGEAISKGLEPLSKWMDENSDFVAEMQTLAGREEEAADRPT